MDEPSMWGSGLISNRRPFYTPRMRSRQDKADGVLPAMESCDGLGNTGREGL